MLFKKLKISCLTTLPNTPYMFKFTKVKYEFLFSNYDNEDTTFLLLFFTRAHAQEN